MKDPFSLDRVGSATSFDELEPVFRQIYDRLRVTAAFPLYVECIADFCNCITVNSGNIPSGLAVAGYAFRDQHAATSYLMEVAITGNRGDKTVTVGAITGPDGTAGAIADMGGTWGAVVQHKDGTYGIYTVANAAVSSCDLYPSLRKDAYRLWNLFPTAGDQHLTAPGYRALAQHIFYYPKQRAYRSKYINRYDCAALNLDTVDGWFRVQTQGGGLPATGRYAVQNLNIKRSSDLDKCTRVFIIDKQVATHNAQANGDGMRRIVNVGSQAGIVDFSVGIYASTITNPQPMRVQVRAFNAVYPFPAGPNHAESDGQPIYDAYHYGLDRVVVPFPAGTTHVSVTLSATHATTNAGYNIAAGPVTVWKDELTQHSAIFTPGSRVVLLADSWGSRAGSAEAAELNRLLSADGGWCKVISKASMTAQWALDGTAMGVNYGPNDLIGTVLSSYNPTHVVIQFFTNDHNDTLYSTLTDKTNAWIANINAIANRCLAAGVQPVIVMPVFVAGESSAQNHAIMAGSLGAGTAG